MKVSNPERPLDPAREYDNLFDYSCYRIAPYLIVCILHFNPTWCKCNRYRSEHISKIGDDNMRLIYDAILEIKYGLTEENALKIDTMDGETTVIKSDDKLACVDNIMRITNRNGRICIINIDYITRIYKVEQWL